MFQTESRPAVHHVSHEYLGHKTPLEKPFHEISISKMRNQKMDAVDECDG